MIETILSNLDGLRLASTPSEKEHFVAVITEQLNLICKERNQYRDDWMIAVRQNERLAKRIAELKSVICGMCPMSPLPEPPEMNRED